VNLQAPEDSNESQNEFLHPGGENAISRYVLTKPDDQVNRWLDEIKNKLLKSDKKDEDDNGTN
jgi:hypothetical protein